MAEPLSRAKILQDEAAGDGFDWPDIDGVWLKVEEELSELRAAHTPAEQLDELGDVLFVLVNLARHMQLDAREALDQANHKFVARYSYIQQHMGQLPPKGDAERVVAMERLWCEAKRLETRRMDSCRDRGAN